MFYLEIYPKDKFRTRKVHAEGSAEGVRGRLFPKVRHFAEGSCGRLLRKVPRKVLDFFDFKFIFWQRKVLRKVLRKVPAEGSAEGPTNVRCNCSPSAGPRPHCYPTIIQAEILSMRSTCFFNPRPSRVHRAPHAEGSRKVPGRKLKLLIILNNSYCNNNW